MTILQRGTHSHEQHLSHYRIAHRLATLSNGEASCDSNVPYRRQFELQGLHFQSCSLLMAWARQQQMMQVFGSLLAWETWAKSHVSGFNLASTGDHLVCEPADGGSPSLHFSPSLILPFKSIKIFVSSQEKQNCSHMEKSGDGTQSPSLGTWTHAC